MIEEKAEVVHVSGQDVWVETQRQSACGQCSVNKGCGTSVIGKVVGNKTTRVSVLNPDNVAVALGDQVLIGIQEQALVRGSLAIYLMPLFFMFLFGLLGEGLGQQLAMDSTDGFVVILSLLGLALGFLWVRIFSRGIAQDNRYQPVLLRRLNLDPHVNLSDIRTL
jgi:sigma-E factor negative regulatory protein RseC